VERDPGYAAQARERLDEVVEADLEALDPEPLGTFDVLIAGDVLEHLADPWGVLRRFAAALEPGGTAVVSLPNVRHWESVFAIAVQGRFPRRNEGVFDATHLRWFTLHDAWALVDQAGLRVEAVERRIRYRRVGGAKETAAAKLIARVPGPRAFLTYQHVLRARK
jgi:SAM-dependent methyltransferase